MDSLQEKIKQEEDEKTRLQEVYNQGFEIGYLQGYQEGRNGKEEDENGDEDGLSRTKEDEDFKLPSEY